MRKTGTGWQASCGWLPSRYSAATATWVRATGIFAQGWAPPKQSRRWHATWPASSTASSPKATHALIAEPNSSSSTAKRAIWPDFRLRLTHVDAASCLPRIKSPEMSLNRSEFLESGVHGVFGVAPCVSGTHGFMRLARAFLSCSFLCRAPARPAHVSAERSLLA
jgi:hypothetical protein